MADREVLQDRASAMRKAPTGSERAFWRYLRDKQLSGYKFRRQVVIGNYIVDFCCYQARVIVELDGSGHLVQVAYDLERKRWLESQGFRVLRFGSEIVEWSDGEMLGVILKACEEQTALLGKKAPVVRE
jgi:very-short-patch-repair endonuclease